MNQQFIRIALLFLVCAFAVASGVQAQKGKAKVNMSKVTAALDKTHNPAQCKTPRPKNRGCSIACKPCFVPVCENGKWMFEKVEILEEECRPRPRQQTGVCMIEFLKKK